MTFVGGKGALYVNPYKIKSINHGIKRLINSHRLRNGLIKKGFENVKRFKRSKILKEHYNCYDKILKNNI